MIDQSHIKKRFNLIYSALRSSGAFHTDKELAKKIGFTPQQLNEVLKGRTKFNLNFLQKFCNEFDVSLDFLALGIQKPNEPVLLHKESVTKSVTNQKDKKSYTSDIIMSPEGKVPRHLSNDELVPYYDTDFAANSDIKMIDDASAAPSYYMDIPEFSGCTAFRAYSDSMEKLIKSGSILFATKIESWLEHLEYGQIYGIVCNDGRRYLKYIRRADKHKEEFLLRSENADYDDFDMPKQSIRNIWLIHGWLNKRT